jgi:YgiT-type zinc finger domain-containing protein
MDIEQVKALIRQRRYKTSHHWKTTQPMSKRTFDCHFCGRQVTAQDVDVMRQWKGRYILIENVPAHVCTQCGERYYDAGVAEAMDEIMRASETELDSHREICIPVIDNEDDKGTRGQGDKETGDMPPLTKRIVSVFPYLQ